MFDVPRTVQQEEGCGASSDNILILGWGRSPPVVLHVNLSEMIPTCKDMFWLRKNECISYEVSLPSPSDDPDSDHFIVRPSARGPQPHTPGSSSGIWIDPTTIRRK